MWTAAPTAVLIQMLFKCEGDEASETSTGAGEDGEGVLKVLLSGKLIQKVQ